MKKYINKIVLLASVVLLATSCSLDTKLFEASDSFVAFKAATIRGSETASIINVPVIVASLKGNPSETVTVEVVAETGEKIAIEGVDFTIESKTLTFADGMGIANIVVKPIDNLIFTGNKTFNLRLAANSQKYPYGAISVVTVTLVDNEHPLAKWIGSYSVACASYGKPGTWDETWAVTTAPDPNDVNNLLVTGISNSANALIATLDMTAMTISIKGGQEISGYGYSLGIYLGTTDLSSVDKTAKIIGTISNDGGIKVDLLSPMIIAGANSGVIWDTFNTTWTKQ